MISSIVCQLLYKSQTKRRWCAIKIKIDKKYTINHLRNHKQSNFLFVVFILHKIPNIKRFSYFFPYQSSFHQPRYVFLYLHLITHRPLPEILPDQQGVETFPIHSHFFKILQSADISFEIGLFIFPNKTQDPKELVLEDTLRCYQLRYAIR